MPTTYFRDIPTAQAFMSAQGFSYPADPGLIDLVRQLVGNPTTHVLSPSDVWDRATAVAFLNKGSLRADYDDRTVDLIRVTHGN